jgi:hypothetical protein
MFRLIVLGNTSFRNNAILSENEGNEDVMVVLTTEMAVE